MKIREISLFQKKANDFFYNFELIVLSSNIIILSILMFANVLGRFMGHSITWLEEIAQLQIFMITFIGISYGARKARHIRMGAILELLNKKLKKVMVIITSIGTMLVLFYLGYHAMKYTLNVMKSMRMTPSLLWPYWVFLIWAPIGFGLGGIQYLRTIIKNIKDPEIWWSAEEKSEYIDDDIEANEIENSKNNFNNI